MRPRQSHEKDEILKQVQDDKKERSSRPRSWNKLVPNLFQYSGQAVSWHHVLTI